MDGGDDNNLDHQQQLGGEEDQVQAPGDNVIMNSDEQNQNAAAAMQDGTDVMGNSAGDSPDAGANDDQQ